MVKDIGNRHGFTLIELVLVVVIIAVLGTIALRSIAPVAENAKVEETRREMETLACAIAGNPQLCTNGTRTDFGYVGDVGSLPPTLDALVANPGYATWNGPYISNRLMQAPDDFKRDAWQMDYLFTGLTIASAGSGDTLERRFAGSSAQLLANNVSGNIHDLDGTPPGGIYDDSVIVMLIHPDGSGGYRNRTAPVDEGGYFQFDSVPIGNHSLDIIYTPKHDTLRRFVSAPPNSQVYGDYFLARDVWPAGQAGGLEFVPDSDTLTTGNCYKLVFWVSNSSSAAVAISSLTMVWPSPIAYYQDVVWNGTTVRTGNPALGSGDMAVFTSAQSVSAGGTARIQIESFHRNSNGSGPRVDMTGTIFTVEFSDGSVVTFTADLCQG
jgi:prepilin-type N-terminal cleavage/methylation domain-containing protein